MKLKKSLVIPKIKYIRISQVVGLGLIFIFFVNRGMAEQVISQTKLFVSGLPRKMRGKHLREEFEKFGEVVFARVVLDNETGRSRGFGFVEFANAEDAAKAQAEMNEKEIWERQVRVDFAKENPERMQARENGAQEAKVVKLNPDQDEELDMAA